MKIMTVVGARPQFIKAAMVSQFLRARHREVLVHTGQHYDYNMSDKFFEELNIPKPDYNLGISGGSHATMTGSMMMSIEKTVVNEQPDAMLLYGDTNSTLAAALAASKLHIPICHVEAGTRTHNINNPEEINRVCVDHVSSLLLACTDVDMDNLQHEGLGNRGRIVGDTMYDAFLKYRGILKPSEITLNLLNGDKMRVPEKYCYMTCHREENTNDVNLTEILCAMEQCDYPTIYPVHPRNKERAIRLKEKNGFQNIILTEPIGYLESNCLVNNAEWIVTDSGGLQREAFFAERPCITILDFMVWPALHVGNRNQLARPKRSEIINKMKNKQTIDKSYQPFGDGHAAERIVKEIEKLDV